MEENRAARLCLAAVLICPAAATAAGRGDAMPVLPVMIEDQSSEAGPDLAAAQAAASHIYGQAGVRLHWMPADDRAAAAAAGAVRIVAIGEPRARRVFTAPDNVLGIALAAANRVYVHAGRIAAFARVHDVGIGVLLGMVIAHELGHVLLPESGHAREGLMSAGFAGSAWRKDLLTFTAAEAAAVRVSVRSRYGASADLKLHAYEADEKKAPAATN